MLSTPIESLKVLFFVLLVTHTIVAALDTDQDFVDHEDDFDDHSRGEIKETASLQGLSHFLAQQKMPANYTCEKFPRVCGLKDSAGPDCCKKKCVNVKTDQLNCGMCGYKCKYAEICCGGRCVNASFDKSHCGGFHKKCKKGELCVYGMCDYA
ncbi:stigma-specific STIG1-like protein 2 [Camellia sinensis]|uniref:Stigma-specific STIG1-like protein 1 n=1 Tax=Camellia sinensis var. sinensis TaxID=542762 RepID=A0A4S4D3K5_CAMSN|nr:stigma-specific STIG1-like protein 2 [Camellia sinensis]THF96890.1 hypothetical protein TEA_020577 [Camellia sinensis var. sinensis]